MRAASSISLECAEACKRMGPRRDPGPLCCTWPSPTPREGVERPAQMI